MQGLKSEQIDYVSQALYWMVQTKSRQSDVLSEAHDRIANAAQYVATVVGPEAASKLLRDLADNVDENGETLLAMHEGFKLSVDLSRGLSKL